MTANTERLKEFMNRRKLDAIIATSPVNVTYLGGFWSMSQWTRRGPQVFVLFTRDAPDDMSLIVESGALDLVADQGVSIDDIRPFGKFAMNVDPQARLDPVDARQDDLFTRHRYGSAIEALSAAVEERGLAGAAIGLDENGILPQLASELRARFDHASFSDAADLLARVRSVKTESEIGILREAAHIAERSIEAALALAAEGITEREMRKAFNGCVVAHDALPAVCCVGFGNRSAYINAQPSDRALERGNVIRFDVGARYRHYRSDISRIAFFGDPPGKLAAYHKAVRAGVMRGHEIIRPGLKVSELFAEVVATVQREGIPHFDRSHVGHGIGLDAYDPPSLSPQSTDVLEENMVLCIETPYYELGFAGVQVEDMVRVTRDGAESLMSTDSELRVIA